MDANGGIEVGFGCSQSDSHTIALCDLAGIWSHEVKSYHTLLPKNKGLPGCPREMSKGLLGPDIIDVHKGLLGYPRDYWYAQQLARYFQGYTGHTRD